MVTPQDRLIRLEQAVNDLCRKPVERFYAEAFVRKVQLPVDVVRCHLEHMAGQGRLKMVVEIHCPECDRRLMDFPRRDEVPQTVYCVYCGIDFVVDEKLTLTAFQCLK